MHSGHEYQGVGIDTQDRSSHEEYGLLNENTDEWKPRPWKIRVRNTVNSYGGFLNTCLLLIIIAFLIEQRWHGAGDDHQIGGDLTGFAPPHFSQHVTTFQPDVSFVPENTSEFWSNAVQNKWLSIVPRGLGYVRVENPAQYNDLPTPIHDYTNMTVFTTSVAHQLHCLYNILAVYAAITGTNPNEIPTGMTFHLQHCFEYLRLNIMCSGDIALEGAETTFPEGFDGSDGWDSKHICKDYSQVYEYMDKNRANDKIWIDMEF